MLFVALLLTAPLPALNSIFMPGGPGPSFDAIGHTLLRVSRALVTIAVLVLAYLTACWIQDGLDVTHFK
jgi:hypothetical protein